MTLGAFKRFQADDYLMLVVLCFYTADIVTITIVKHTSSNLLPPGYDVDHLSKQDIHEREYGSKLILVVEQCQIMTVWGAKACLIMMYMRLTTLRKENIAIKMLAGYVAFGFCFMEIFYFGVWCRPFHDYWAVPTPNVQCDAATNHLITNAVFNLSSDCIMLAIALPMFLRMQMPWKKKIPIVGIFSLGVFVILAAVLNKVYSFTQPFGSAWTYWYIRESSTALLVANLPFLWALVRRITGTKTVKGVSRQPIHSPEKTLSGGNMSDGKRKDSANASTALPWEMYGAGDSMDDLEMAEAPKRPGLTFHDMLRESNPDLTVEENVTPITHPGLFFGTGSIGTGGKQMKAAEGSHARMPKAVVSENSEQELVRRTSSPEARPDNTPASSLFPQSLNSEKIAGSFL